MSRTASAGKSAGKRQGRSSARRKNRGSSIVLQIRRGGKWFICNCCGCCCGVLRAVNQHNIPTAMTKSNYYAKVDPELCTGCESCVDRCQVNAIRVQDGSATIDKARCIGCGLCVSTCPTDSVSLVHKGKDDLSVIFPDPMALVQAIGKEKGKAFPFE